MQRNNPPSSGSISHGPKSVTEFGPVAALAKRAGELEALDRALRQTLPSPLREQVRFANLRDGRLVFLAPSPAWASRLRLSQAQILSAAHALGVHANVVTVKVAPLPPTQTEPDRTKPLSAAAANHLKAAAASTSDPELRELFLELASVADISASRTGGTP